MSTATKHPECLLIVHNEVVGRRSESILPSTPDEAPENCLEITRAVQFADHLDVQDLYRDGDPEPLAVSIRKGHDTIVVCWYLTGDVDSARARFHEIQEGRALI